MAAFLGHQKPTIIFQGFDNLAAIRVCIYTHCGEKSSCTVPNPHSLAICAFTSYSPSRY
jgi:hypothetical protein